VHAAYNELVPDFERLFERSGGDFRRFYAEVKAMAALPKAERRAKLAAVP
jgi:predicted aminopeptidase